MGDAAAVVGVRRSVVRRVPRGAAGEDRARRQGPEVVAGQARREERGAEEEVEPELPPKVLEVYQSVGVLLSRYRSGAPPP